MSHIGTVKHIPVEHRYNFLKVSSDLAVFGRQH
jgi:hypothetical protein